MENLPKNNWITYGLSLLYFCLLTNTVSAQDAIQPPSIFQSIQNLSDSIPTIRIASNWKKLVKDKLKEEYQEAQFSFTNADGEEIALKAKIRARGNIRKKVCYYPPVKIKFKKKHLAAMGFDTLNKLKFVIQCRRGNTGEGYLFKERFIYDLHEQIGPISYRTKLVKIELLEEGKDHEPLFGFLIEEEEEFGKRLSADVLEVGRIRSKLIDRNAYLKMVFFQYLILNTDWSVRNKHNIEFVWVKDSGKFVPVPYDFDYCGLVGTDYAVPSEALGISSVKEALFRGKDITEKEALATAKFFLAQKDQLYQRLEEYPYFDKREKTSFKMRMDDFFELLANKKRIIRNFANAE